MIKYIKSVLWREAKCLSYIEEARCLKVKIEALLSDPYALYACSNLISGNYVTSLMHITLNNHFTEVGLTETLETYITEVVLMYDAQLSSCSLVNTAKNGNTGSTFKTDRSKSRPKVMFKASYLTKKRT